eukprot:5912440-Ditylum_brightwellii.AAC.1
MVQNTVETSDGETVGITGVPTPQSTTSRPMSAPASPSSLRHITWSDAVRNGAPSKIQRIARAAEEAAAPLDQVVTKISADNDRHKLNTWSRSRQQTNCRQRGSNSSTDDKYVNNVADDEYLPNLAHPTNAG